MENTATFLQQAYVARGQTEASWKQAQTWHGDESSSTADASEGDKSNPWGRYGSDRSDSSGLVLGKKRKAKTSSSDEVVTKKKKKSKKSQKMKKAKAMKDASSDSSGVIIDKKKTSRKRKNEAPSTDSADAKTKRSSKKDGEAFIVEHDMDETVATADEPNPGAAVATGD